MVARIQPQTGHDVDPAETEEWLESLEAVLERDGVPRAHFLIENLIAEARRAGANLPYSANTAYLNTIPEARERHTPGDPSIEWRIRSLVRWNAMAMVVQANRESAELGGHIASFASAATLYEVGFNHFWHAPTPEHGGDLVYIQGHSAPGIYARAFLEGAGSRRRISTASARRRTGRGLSSYPHPWLMPSFWQFPTVSMGLGPIQAIYHARFMRYLDNRGLLHTEGRKVWCFVGDGEMDEPESLGAITLAAREQLDNLVFVVNCNLQRLDGPPVRGNGKIIQELEAAFRGAGWNVIKVIWGSYWDALLMRDTRGLLRRRMEEAVDGEYQNFKAKGGGYTREYFFGKYPELQADGRQHERRRHLAPQPGRARPPQGLRRLRPGGRPPRPAHRHPREDGEGLRDGRRRGGAERHPPAEEDGGGRAPGVPGPVPDPPHRRPDRGRSLLPPPARQPGDPVPEGAAPRSRRLSPRPRGPRRAARGPRHRHLREPARGEPGPGDLDHDGLRAAADGAAARQDGRAAGGAHRARRGAHLRHGGPVPAARDLLVQGPALRAAGRRPAHVLPRGRQGPDPRRRDQRGGRLLLMDRRRHLVRQPWPYHDPVLHLLLDVRVPEHRRPRVGGGGTSRHGGFCSARRRAGRPSAARAFSTATATATSSPRTSRTAWPTIRPSPASSRSSCMRV